MRLALNRSLRSASVKISNHRFGDQVGVEVTSESFPSGREKDFACNKGPSAGASDCNGDANQSNSDISRTIARSVQSEQICQDANIMANYQKFVKSAFKDPKQHKRLSISDSREMLNRLDGVTQKMQRALQEMKLNQSFQTSAPLHLDRPVGEKISMNYCYFMPPDKQLRYCASLIEKELDRMLNEQAEPEPSSPVNYLP